MTREKDVMLPNLIIPGAQKSGTTYLAYLLGQHPEIYLPEVKEPSHYLARHEKPVVWPNGRELGFAYRDRDEYRSLYAAAKDQTYRVDASTGYLAMPDVAERIRDEVGSAKIICVVRQPVDRAYSAYVYYRQLHETESETFDEALAEMDALIKNPDVTVAQPYFGTGHYAQHIRMWQGFFGEENVHIVFFDDLRKDPQGVCDKVFAFLGLEPMNLDAEVEQNSSHAPLRGWRKFLLRASRGQYAALAPLTFALRTVMPSNLRNRVRLAFKRNLRPPPGSNRPEKLSPEDRARFTAQLETQIDDLAALTGRSLDDWKITGEKK